MEFFLKAHKARIRGICVPYTRGVYEVEGGPTKYVVSFSNVVQEVRCPVPECTAVAHIAGSLHKHFMFCHFRYKVAVVQKGKEPLLHCDMCVMHMSAGRII